MVRYLRLLTWHVSFLGLGVCMLHVYYTERWYNMDRYGLTSDDSGVLEFIWNSLRGRGKERVGGSIGCILH
jgi:hypothetical protein